MCLFEGCYPDSIKSLPKVFEMTMTISSVEMCQEICHHENIRRFAVKVDIRNTQETVFLFQSDWICINMTPFSYFL